MKQVMNDELNRRTLLRAASWTVPVVTVIAAAPAFAASPPAQSGYEMRGVHTDDGNAEFSVLNHSLTDTLVVTISIATTTPTARLQRLRIVTGWNFSTFGGQTYTLSATVPPASISGLLELRWTRVADDGALTITATTPEQQPQTLSLPWAQT